jgi:hypothetical protein
LRFLVLLLLAFPIGCRTPEYYAFTNAYNLPPLDSSGMMPRSVNNLDVLRGIDNWRLGMPKKYYKNAFQSDSAYRNTDTCMVVTKIQHFHEWSECKLYFLGDTLDQFTLYMHCRHPGDLYRQLCDLYGGPTGDFVNMSLGDDTTIYFKGLPPAGEPAAYDENPNKTVLCITNGVDSLPLYTGNTITLKGLKEDLRHDTTQSSPAVKFHYYPRCRVEARWVAQRSLRMVVYKETTLVPVGENDSTLHVARTGYFATLDFFSRPIKLRPPLPRAH